MQGAGQGSIRPRAAVTPKPGRYARGALVTLCLCTLITGLASAERLNRAVGWPGSTLSGVPCYGEGTSTRFDYVTEKNQLDIVERFHFKESTQQLLDHDSRLAEDLDYTLRSIPNHHRALWVNVLFYLKLTDRLGSEELQQRAQRQSGQPPPECYFHRGKAFNPGDPMVSAIFGVYLHKRGMLSEALQEYRLAEQRMPRNGELIYNMGLLFVDMGDLAAAQDYADRARTLGYSLRGLQRRIDREVANAQTPG